MKKPVLYSLVIVVLGLNLFLGAQIYFTSAQAAEKTNLYQQMDVFVRVLEKVRSEYVDGDKLTYDELVRGAMRGMLGTLDPHSEYMEPQKHEELKNDTEGAFGGVGIVIGMRDNVLTVVAPMDDTPAFRAGVLPGDRILKIDGRSTEKLKQTDAVHILRGVPGTVVTLTMSRPSWPEPKEIPLTRAQIKVATVKDLDGRQQFPVTAEKIGYVRLTQFGEQTATDLKKALEKMNEQEMQGLILDLRGNPGGLLPQAVKVCELFLRRGEVIVSTEGQNAESRDRWYAQSRDVLGGKPIVILVNNGSASASEIVAGCLQDLSRAFIMGEQTFGKGSVQTIIPLQDGAALRLTTAKYYTPSHKVIHEHGITPDSVVPMSPEDEEALAMKRTPGALENLTGESRVRAEAVRDVQMDRATDFLKGMILYKDRSYAQRKGAEVKP